MVWWSMKSESDVESESESSMKGSWKAIYWTLNKSGTKHKKGVDSKSGSKIYSETERCS